MTLAREEGVTAPADWLLLDGHDRAVVASAGEMDPKCVVLARGADPGHGR
ncbi:hypothetical protein ACFY0F_03205 [Streptomyces sp. NPDC001544]